MVSLFKILQFKHLVNLNKISFVIKNKCIFFKGSVPINCTIDFGNGQRQSNGTTRDQYYTVHFSRNYTTYGEYNVTCRCFNELGVNTTQITRNIRREGMRKKILKFVYIMETPTATIFHIIINEGFLYRHPSCLHLSNIMADDNMRVLWRRKTLEVIPNKVIDHV